MRTLFRVIAFFALLAAAPALADQYVQNYPVASPVPSDLVLATHAGATSNFTVGSLAGPIAGLITPSMLAAPTSASQATFPTPTGSAFPYVFPNGTQTGAAASAQVTCDGLTDDGPAINTMIAALAATYSSATITIPYLNSGICAIGTPIVLANNITLQGASRNVTLKRKTGATMEAMLYNAAQSAIDPYNGGTYRPSTRTISLPDLVGAVPRVYDWSVSNNWYNAGQTVQNLTFDGNSADTTGSVTYGILFAGAAHFTHRHLTFQNFGTNGQTDSIWYSAHFLVDDVDNTNVYQGPSVQLASYDFTVENIRTIGYQDSGVGCISNPTTPYTTPYEGHWSNLFFDGLGTAPIGFDHASCISQTISNLHAKNVTTYGLNVHENSGVPGGYLQGTNITVENTGAVGSGGIRISEPNVHLVNVASNNNAASGFFIVGDEVNNGSGGFVDAQVADIDIVSPTAQQNASGNYGALLNSVTLSGLPTTIKRVTFSGGSLGDPSSTQSLGLAVVLGAGAGTIDDVSVIGTTLRPSSSGSGVSFGGIAHYQYLPSPTDVAAGDYTTLSNLQIPAPTVATSASPHPGSDILQFASSDWNGTTAVTNNYNLQASNGALFCASACVALAIGNTSITQTGLSFNSSGDVWSIASSSSGFNVGPTGTTSGVFNLYTNGQSNAATFSLSSAGTATVTGSTPLAFSNTSGATITLADTGSTAALALNANGTGFTGDLLDLKLAGTAKLTVSNTGAVTSSGAVTGTSIVVSGTNANNATAYEMPNASTATGSGHFTICGTNSSSSVGGGPVAPTVIGCADYGAGTGYGFGMDQNSNFGVAGKVESIGCVIPGNGTTTGTAEFCSGSGAPTFSAPNASVYLRYDGTPGSSSFYINTSGASTSGTTWTAKF